MKSPMTSMARRAIFVGFLIVVGLSFSQAQAEQEWGDLKGTFVFKGEIPKASRIKVTKDTEFCGKHDLVDEALVVNAENKGIADIVVWMYLKKNAAAPPIHESYKETENAEVPLDNKNCAFEPRVVLLRTTQTLLIGNKDLVSHNTMINTAANTAINRTVPAKGMLKWKFEEKERRPATVGCGMHPWMKGWLLVKDNPFFAVTDKDGKFEIKNVPAGEWTFQFWQEKAGYVDDVVIDGKSKKWKKGRKAIEITEKGTDLGKIEVPAETFQ